MSFITHTDKSAIDLYEDQDGSRIDLSNNERLTELLDLRTELSVAVQALRKAEQERKDVDKEIISLLGNASSAIAADGTVVTVRPTTVPEHVVATYSFVRVFISHKKARDWREILKGLKG